MNLSPDNSKLSFIHRYHLLLKTHYFLFYAAFGVVYPILNLTLRSHGLSNTEISLANVILPFSIFLTSPLVGFIADKSRRFLLTFNILFIIVSITFTALFLLPHIKSHYIQADSHYFKSSAYVLDFCASQEVVTKCSSRSRCGCSYQAYCKTENFLSNFTLTMNSNNVEKHLKENLQSQCGIDYRVTIDKMLLNADLDFPNSSMIKCQITCSIPYFCHGVRYEKQRIYIVLYAILYVVGSNLLSSSYALGTTIGFACLPRADLFGKQRVWGTIGFGILAFSTSRIYEFFRSEFVYLILFNTIAILTIIITSFIPIHINDKQNNEEKKNFNFTTLKVLLKNIDVFIFLSIAFLWGMSFGSIHPYLALYVDEIAPCQSRTLICSMFAIAAISEIIAFYLAKRVINGYYFLPRPYFYLIVETMHFFNFGILYVLIAQKADLIAPPGLSGTLQGITHGVLHGLSNILGFIINNEERNFICFPKNSRGTGLLVSSFIYIVLQQRLLFLVFAILNIIAASIYSIYFLLTRKKSTNTNVTVSNNNNNNNNNNVSVEEGNFVNKIKNKYLI
ncbi:unnamed protein product [Rotaria socialis]|uniref:Major facilitator superfamily associated domain-containing protein n=2 Tax=Rotaria socialis TaxID=392032 RepID=A0A821NQQ8_9BILA|nr:unnamed protein product [Rotaria socialis]